MSRSVSRGRSSPPSSTHPAGRRRRCRSSACPTPNETPWSPSCSVDDDEGADRIGQVDQRARNRDWCDGSRTGDAAAFEELLAAHRASAFQGRDRRPRQRPRRRRRRAGRERPRLAVGVERRRRSRLPVVVPACRRQHGPQRSALAWPSGGARAASRRRNPAATCADPEEHAVTDADRRRVIDAMNRLDRDDRLVIALRHFEQLSENEMADVLGCANGTVKSRLSRAMSRLRALSTTIGPRRPQPTRRRR